MPITPVDIEDNKINHYSLFFIEPDGVKTVRFFAFSDGTSMGTEGTGTSVPLKVWGQVPPSPSGYEYNWCNAHKDEIVKKAQNLYTMYTV